MKPGTGPAPSVSFDQAITSFRQARTKRFPHGRASFRRPRNARSPGVGIDREQAQQGKVDQRSRTPRCRAVRAAFPEPKHRRKIPGTRAATRTDQDQRRWGAGGCPLSRPAGARAAAGGVRSECPNRAATRNRPLLRSGSPSPRSVSRDRTPHRGPPARLRIPRPHRGPGPPDDHPRITGRSRALGKSTGTPRISRAQRGSPASASLSSARPRTPSLR